MTSIHQNFTKGLKHEIKWSVWILKKELKKNQGQWEKKGGHFKRYELEQIEEQGQPQGLVQMV